MRAGLDPANPTQSRGFALIVGLLLLASMVVIALAVATGMLLEQRMAGNFADGQLALQRAQLAGQWARYWLESREANPLQPDCGENCGPTPPLFAGGAIPAFPEFEDAGWWRFNAVIAGREPGGEVRMDYSIEGVEAPRWLVEELHLEPLEGLLSEPGEPAPQLAYYRILARGSGRLPASVAVTESLIARPWAAVLEPGPFGPVEGQDDFCEQVPDEVPCGRVAWRRRR